MKEYKEKLTAYYNKFNEDKRLLRRHGQVEYITTMKYIHRFLKTGDKVLDVGAGTGRYSIALRSEGYDVTAFELCRPNIGMMRKNDPELKVVEGDARDLSAFEDESFDVVLLFGPMYHLPSEEDKLKALSEARRVCRTGGTILVAYLMNDYAVVFHAFMEGHYREISSFLDENYKVLPGGNDLYSYVRLDEVRELSDKCGLSHVLTIAADGPSDYIRPVLNAMDEETFSAFIDYHLSVCEREELLGSSSHIVDILGK